MAVRLCQVCEEPDPHGDHECWRADPWAHWDDGKDPDSEYVAADLDPGREPVIVTLDTRGLL